MLAMSRQLSKKVLVAPFISVKNQTPDDEMLAFLGGWIIFLVDGA
jgi:hypothetical protein